MYFRKQRLRSAISRGNAHVGIGMRILVEDLRQTPLWQSLPHTLPVYLRQLMYCRVSTTSWQNLPAYHQQPVYSTGRLQTSVRVSHQVTSRNLHTRGLLKSSDEVTSTLLLADIPGGNNHQQMHHLRGRQTPWAQKTNFSSRQPSGSTPDQG